MSVCPPIVPVLDTVIAPAGLDASYNLQFNAKFEWFILPTLFSTLMKPPVSFFIGKKYAALDPVSSIGTGFPEFPTIGCGG